MTGGVVGFFTGAVVGVLFLFGVVGVGTLSFNFGPGSFAGAAGVVGAGADAALIV